MFPGISSHAAGAFIVEMEAKSVHTDPCLSEGIGAMQERGHGGERRSGAQVKHICSLSHMAFLAADYLQYLRGNSLRAMQMFHYRGSRSTAPCTTEKNDT